jgi:hypothetical protein
MPNPSPSLIQASSILHACQDASDNGEGGYDLAPALRVAVTLLEAAEAGFSMEEDQHGRGTRDDSSPLIEAYSILKACISMEATGADWGLTWALLPVVRLVDGVIKRRQSGRPRTGKRSARTKPGLAGNVVSLVSESADS